MVLGQGCYLMYNNNPIKARSGATFSAGVVGEGNAIPCSEEDPISCSLCITLRSICKYKDECGLEGWF